MMVDKKINFSETGDEGGAEKRRSDRASVTDKGEVEASCYSVHVLKLH